MDPPSEYEYTLPVTTDLKLRQSRRTSIDVKRYGVTVRVTLVSLASPYCTALYYTTLHCTELHSRKPSHVVSRGQPHTVNLI